MAEPRDFSQHYVRLFWEHVKAESATACWLWNGGRCSTLSYPQFRRMPAHRYSWKLHGGEVPAGLILMHKCDDRRCVNPRHLRVGTHKENSRDMVRKGRQHYSGQQNYSAAVHYIPPSRGRGRPRKYKHTQITSLRLPADLMQALRSFALTENTSVNDLLVLTLREVFMPEVTHG